MRIIKVGALDHKMSRVSLTCLVLTLTLMTGEGRPGNLHDQQNQEHHRVHVLQDHQMELGNIDSVGYRLLKRRQYKYYSGS